MNGHCEERDEAIHRCVIAGGFDPSADATWRLPLTAGGAKNNGL
jgi:hypothetical protein